MLPVVDISPRGPTATSKARIQGGSGDAGSAAPLRRVVFIVRALVCRLRYFQHVGTAFRITFIIQCGSAIRLWTHGGVPIVLRGAAISLRGAPISWNRLPVSSPAGCPVRGCGLWARGPRPALAFGLRPTSPQPPRGRPPSAPCPLGTYLAPTMLMQRSASSTAFSSGRPFISGAASPST